MKDYIWSLLFQTIFCHPMHVSWRKCIMFIHIWTNKNIIPAGRGRQRIWPSESWRL